MLPATEQRVPEHTSEHANRKIREQAEIRVEEGQRHPDRIATHLAKLDREWDVERTLEANASTLAFAGTVLAFFVHPYFLAIPAIVTAFLFEHALQGWCPPLPVLRALGFRTAREIAEERNALKALRGDYRDIGPASSPERALEAARR